jgi:hypothetical protein
LALWPFSRFCDAGQRLAVLVTEIREVADHKELRVAGNGQVRLNEDAPRFVDWRAGLVGDNFAEWRGKNSGGPKDGAGRNDFGVIAPSDGYRLWAHAGDEGARANDHA